MFTLSLYFLHWGYFWDPECIVGISEALSALWGRGREWGMFALSQSLSSKHLQSSSSTSTNCLFRSICSSIRESVNRLDQWVEAIMAIMTIYNIYPAWIYHLHSHPFGQLLSGQPIKVNRSSGEWRKCSCSLFTLILHQALSFTCLQLDNPEDADQDKSLSADLSLWCHWW